VTNRERAERAQVALVRYKEPDAFPPDVEEALTDFITDAIHLLGRDAVRDSLRMAEIHHQAELEEGGAE
jgi:hypothetical protein